MNQAQAMHGRRLEACGFEEWDSTVDESTVVYCDPPYAGTTGYRAVGAFDHTRFWDVAGRWADRGAVVLVSEYAAPDGWTVAAEFEHVEQLARVVQESGDIDHRRGSIKYVRAKNIRRVAAK